MTLRQYLLSIVFFLINSAAVYADEPITISDPAKLYKIGDKISLFEDKESKMDISQVIRQEFRPSTDKVPNFQISNSTFWAKFTIKNLLADKTLVLDVDHSTIDEIILYIEQKDHTFKEMKLGEEQPFSERFYDHQSYLFPIHLAYDSSATCYLKVKASEQLLLPLRIGYEQTILESFLTKDLIFGLYIGIILVMVVYNLFIFVSVRDSHYLYYVWYIIFVGLSQAMLQGYTFRFLWPNTLWLNNFSAVMIPFINGIAALEFIKRFLHVKVYSVKYYRALVICELLYCVSFVLGIAGMYTYAQLAVQGVAFGTAIVVLFISYKLARTGNRIARLFLLAWCIFLVSVCVFVLRNFNILPYNNFTYYALQIGSALEVTLLSFALADRINLYRKEKEESQADALRIAKENERIIKEQNTYLEEKVTERTRELHHTNTELNTALEDLKHAQTKLVDAEKMASLGQLTAGIAHEINNPINFVSSNIKPLQRDIDDILTIINKYDEIVQKEALQVQFSEIDQLKKTFDYAYLIQEIDVLLKGMGDGAGRTVEIVKGLKSFSRIDESDLKFANINEGIESTLIILSSTFKGRIQIRKELGDIPEVECFAGKLNQVFVNIINNAAQAVLMRNYPGEEGFVIIKTYTENDRVIIRIKDNGIGMPEEVREKIFEPFFTTKKAGEGTGLGLSIVFSIIELHMGEIHVESTPGVGTEFIISLPIHQQ